MSDDECYACMVGVATGPESHTPGCPASNIPMPDQWETPVDGPGWARWRRDRDAAKAWSMLKSLSGPADIGEADR